MPATHHRNTILAQQSCCRWAETMRIMIDRVPHISMLNYMQGWQLNKSLLDWMTDLEIACRLSIHTVYQKQRYMEHMREQHKHKPYVHTMCTIKLLLPAGIAAAKSNEQHWQQLLSKAEYQQKYTKQQCHKAMLFKKGKRPHRCTCSVQSKVTMKVWIFMLFGSRWARYILGNSYLSEAICSVHPHKFYWCDSFANHIIQHHWDYT